MWFNTHRLQNNDLKTKINLFYSSVRFPFFCLTFKKAFPISSSSSKYQINSRFNYLRYSTDILLLLTDYPSIIKVTVSRADILVRLEYRYFEFSDVLHAWLHIMLCSLYTSLFLWRQKQACVKLIIFSISWFFFTVTKCL